MTNTLDAYCVVGNPVAHSRSPWIHARFAELTGQPLSYDRALVPLDGFADFVRDFAARGGKGCNVTVPFKLQAAELATSTSERAAIIRSRVTASAGRCSKCELAWLCSSSKRANN